MIVFTSRTGAIHWVALDGFGPPAPLVQTEDHVCHQGGADGAKALIELLKDPEHLWEQFAP
jgi:hypothetical protein